MSGTRGLFFTVGAVTLLTFLSLIYTVDGQWRRSVAGEIVCDLQKLNRCVEMGERMLQDPRYVFPDTDSDVRDVCQEWENITMCMEEAMRTCVKFPDNEKQLFNNNVGKSIIYVSEICTKEQEKLEYLQHAPCLKEMTRNEFDYCGSYYGQLLSVTRDFKNGIERDEELCCGLNLYKECMLGKFNKCQRNMLRVFGEDSFRKGRDYVSVLLDNALNAQTQHCSSRNYVMSSFNCPQMDKLMEETKRDNARLQIDSRDFGASKTPTSEPASARSQPSDGWIDASRPDVNTNRANDRRGGRIDDPSVNGGNQRAPTGASQPAPSVSDVTSDRTALSGSPRTGNANEGVDNNKPAVEAPARIDPPGRGPLRDRVNPAGTDGFRDNRERGGRRNDLPESNNNGAAAGGYFGNAPQGSDAQASTASQTDPKGSPSDTASERNNDGAYFGRTNYAGFGFDGRGKPNPRPPINDPWENPRTVSPNDINAQGLSGGSNAAESCTAAISTFLTLATTSVLFLYGRWLSQ